MRDRGVFKRFLDQEVRVALERAPLYMQLLPDIEESGEVFPAIRNEAIDFYHRGGSLFSFDKQGFKTHIKYASAYKEHSKDYVTESMLERVEKIRSFTEAYKRIKENCALYAGVEAQGISKIYANYSYARKKTAQSDIVVLDIEISLKAIEEDRSQDRIDLLLYEKGRQRLIFCEAKHFSNGEIWAEEGQDIPVVQQIRRYADQIKDKRERLLEAYTDYVGIVNDLFQLSLPPPETISPVVPLIIFGFDRDQLMGRFKDLFQNNISDDITYYPIGNISGFSPGNLVKKCNL